MTARRGDRDAGGPRRTAGDGGAARRRGRRVKRAGLLIALCGSVAGIAVPAAGLASESRAPVHTSARPAAGAGGACPVQKPRLEAGEHPFEGLRGGRGAAARALRAPAGLLPGAGSLDPSFGGDGRATLNVANGRDEGWDLAADAQGRIVVVGRANAGGRWDVVVVRLLADGSRDQTFGDGGAALVDLGSPDDHAHAIAVGADGAIVVAGSVGAEGVRDVALARLLPDGRPDGAFGGTGVVVSRLSPGDDSAQDVHVLPDGRILAAGYAVGTGRGGGTTDFALLRLRPDGSRDTTFSGDGLVLTDFSARGDAALSVAVQADGRIVAGGWSVGPTGYTAKAALARYRPDGSLDTGRRGFSGDGRLLVAGRYPGGGEALLTAVESIALQPDGRIVTAGWVSDGCFFAWFSVMRHLRSGPLDRSFDSDGMTSTSPSAEALDFASDVVVRANGTIVAAGIGLDGDVLDFDFAFVGFRANGKRDPLFGTGGIAIARFGSADDLGWGLVQLPDGSLVGAGTTGRDIGLSKHRSTGQLDTAFGSAGMLATGVAGGEDSAEDIALGPAGTVIVGGWSQSQPSAPPSFVVARLGPGGAPDPTFAAGGVAANVLVGRAYGLAVQPDGAIVAVGSLATTNNEFFRAVRLGPTGAVDRELQLVGLGSPVARALDVAIAPGGAIVAAGFAHASGVPDFALARWLANGNVDPGFGANGRVRVPISSGADEARAVVAMGDGALLVAGFAEDEGRRKFALARFTPTGALDEEFGQGGIVLTAVGSGDAEANAMVVLANGRIVLAGVAETTAGTGVALARFLPGGALDDGFGANGIVVQPAGSSSARAEDIAVDAEGFLVVAGTGRAATDDFLVLRFRPDGNLDTTFGQGGAALTDVAGGADEAHAVVVTATGRIVAGGSAALPSTGRDMAFVRHLP